MPIPTKEEIEARVAPRTKAFFEVLGARAPRVAKEVRRLCASGTCRSDDVQICSMTRITQHSRSCKSEDGGLLFKVTEYDDNGTAYFTIWSDDALIAALDEALGPAIGNESIRVYANILSWDEMLVHHPKASVLNFGGVTHLPWFTLLPSLRGVLGKPIPEESYRDRAFPLPPPLTPLLVLAQELWVHIVSENNIVRGASACIAYFDAEERTLIWSALQSGITSEPTPKALLASDSFPGLRAYEYPDRTIIVDYPFDQEEQAERYGIGCWLVAVGEIDEDEMFEAI